MTQYAEEVLKRAKAIAAEDWGKKIKEIHCHSLNSMWYEPNPVKVKTRSVMDITYNNGRITRDDIEIVPSQYEKEALVSQWEIYNDEL